MLRMILSFVLFGCFLHSPVQSQTSSVPQEILSYYSDLNKINTYSRPGERDMLARILRTDTPDLTPRLGQILLLMRRTAAKEIPEPHMPMPSGPPLDAQSQDGAYVFQIIESSRSGKRVVVKLQRYFLRPQVISRFIADYDDAKGGNDSLPSEQEVIDRGNRDKYGHGEIHVWKLTPGAQWLRTSRGTMLLGRS